MIDWSNVWGTFKSQLEDKLLPKSGGTMSGDLILRGAPVADNEAATKSYVDKNIRYYETNITLTKTGITQVGTIPDYDPNKCVILARETLWSDRNQYAYNILSVNHKVYLDGVTSEWYNELCIDSSGNVYIDCDKINRSYVVSLIIIPVSKITLATE